MGVATTGRKAAARRQDPPTLRPAATCPVARVAVDIPLAHLDRPFDYLVPERLAAQALPGVRVRVRFAGQLTDGFVLERADASEHQGRLAWLDRVVSPEPVLTPEVAGLAREIADRYAGTLADVLRLAVPPRHAATEAAALARPAPGGAAPGGAAPGGPAQDGPPEPGSWERYPAGKAFLHGVAAGRPVRAAWVALPGDTWPDEIALAVGAAASAGRGALVVVPDARDLARVDQALGAALSVVGPASAAATAAADDADGAPRHVSLTADLGPAERYRRWLAVLRGEVMVVAGTRAAMFAPVRNLGLVVLWDEGDDLHAEPRAPYPNVREVLALRAHRAGAAALIGGFSRTAELARLVQVGWARDLVADRATIRTTAPRVRAAADEYELARDAAATTARLPSLALRTARAALGSGPVLVQVPRRGYLAAIGCGRCRARARCAACGGPLRVGGAKEFPDCGWCGALASGWACPHCGFGQVRAITIGAARTAEELGRAFPGVRVRTSGGSSVIPDVSGEPALIIATPGAEPVGQYAAALLLDGWALLARQSLRSEEEALRRWLAAAALVRADGTVLVHADAALPVVQALIRWDPVTFSERILSDRVVLGFPPATRMAAVTGDVDAVTSLLASLPRPQSGNLEVLGPLPSRNDETTPPAEKEQLRALLRVPLSSGMALARALHAAQAARSGRKEGGGVRVQLDPAELI
jgi:primosomal protein N' (replication factor Y)